MTAISSHHTPADATAGTVSVDDLPLMRLQCDPHIHAAHPDQRECHSLDCLRAHCLHLETTRTTDDIICTPTSPFSGSPSSTRSGTSPGYANDWAIRQERLVIHANEPTKERIDKSVKLLMNVQVKKNDQTTNEGQPAKNEHVDVTAHTVDPIQPTPLSINESSQSTSSPKSSFSTTSSILTSNSTIPFTSTSKLLQRRQQRKQLLETSAKEATNEL